MPSCNHSYVAPDSGDRVTERVGTKGGELNCFGSFFLLPSAVFLLFDLISLLIHPKASVFEQVLHTNDYLPAQ